MYYKRWLKGETLQITADNFGCGGAGTYLFDVVSRTREEYVSFLHGTEGLKATPELMGEWHVEKVATNIHTGPGSPVEPSTWGKIKSFFDKLFN